MRLKITTALLCATMALGTLSGARAAEDPAWQWQAPMTFSATMPAMGADELRKHVGGWVYAPDGSVIGSLDSFTTDNEAVVRGSMFFMGGMKYIMIPNRNLAVMDGRLYAHDVDAAHVHMVVTPQHLVVGL